MRAFYLKEKYALKFSPEIVNYIAEYSKYSIQTFGTTSAKLLETLKKYPKYQEVLNCQNISYHMSETSKNVFLKKDKNYNSNNLVLPF